MKSFESHLYQMVLCVNFTQGSHHRERSFSWGNASMRSSCKALFSIRAHCGWCHPWPGSRGFYKTAGWASHEEQASKQHSSMASASAPASWFWPCWSSCPETVIEINPFLPKLLLVMVFSRSNRNLTMEIFKTNFLHALTWHVESACLSDRKFLLLNSVKVVELF